MKAISLENLSKTYQTGFWMRRFEAVRGISLHVEQGETFGFVGPNGAGKTSTIKILAGLQAPTSGIASIQGVSVLNPLSRKNLGFLPERPYFYTHLTANEVLRFYGSLFEMKESILRERIAHLLERVDMMRFADVPLGKYSKGMLQRVGLCQTLLHDPSVILLDEPMSGLDPVGRALVRDLILEEQEAGRTVFFCSHVLSDVESICERVAILLKGEVKVQGKISELLQHRNPESSCRFVPLPDRTIDDVSYPKERSFHRGRNGLYEIVLNQSQLSQFLRDNIQAIQVVEVTPIKQSLEGLLVELVQQDRMGNLGSSSEVDPTKLGVLA